MIRNRQQFIQYFNNEIYPKYGSDIAREQKAVAEAKKLSIIALISIVIAINIVNIFFGILGIIATILVWFAIVYFVASKNPHNVAKFKRDNTGSSISKEPIFQEIIPKVLPGFAYNNQKGITPSSFKKYKLISDSLIDRFNSDDTIIGKIGGKAIRINDCTIHKVENRSEGNTISINGITIPTSLKGGDGRYNHVLVFAGLLIEFDLGLNPDFQMILKRKEHHSEFLSRSTLEKVNLAHPMLDEEYILETNDTVKSFTILQPRILDRIEALHNDSNEVSISFMNGKVALMVGGDRNIFEIFNEGGFEPDLLWDEIMIIVDSLALLSELEIDYTKNKNNETLLF